MSSDLIKSGYIYVGGEPEAGAVLTPQNWKEQEPKLAYVKDRVIVSIDMEYKNSVTFKDGTKIRLERRFDNFDMKYVQPVNATVLAAKNIPEGAEILIHHNSTHAVNEILNYKQVSGTDIASDIKYFSIPIADCFAWRNDNEWQPLPGFDFALRVFKPYIGVIEGIEPTKIKDVLYVTTGEYKGQVVITLKSSDYEMIFQDVTGREGNLIRFRSSENVKEQRECEVIAIHDQYTEMVHSGSLLVGLSKNNCKKLIYAQ